MWRLVSEARRRLGRSICRFTWHNSTPDSGTIALEAPPTSLSPAEVIFPSLGGNNSEWAGLPAKGLRKATTSTKVIDLNNVCTLQIHSFHCCLFLPRDSFSETMPYWDWSLRIAFTMMVIRLENCFVLQKIQLENEKNKRSTYFPAKTVYFINFKWQVVEFKRI